MAVNGYVSVALMGATTLSAVLSGCSGSSGASGGSAAAALRGLSATTQSAPATISTGGPATGSATSVVGTADAGSTSPVAAAAVAVPAMAAAGSATATVESAAVQSAAQSAPSSIATAPVISGTPAATVSAGKAYSFQPGVTAAAGTAYSFAITNKPRWAVFNAATGALTGTPGSVDVGSYALVAISVRTAQTSNSLPAFTIAVTPAVSSMTLSWTGSTQNTNGSALTDLAGYHIYYGTAPTAMTTVATATAAAGSQVIANLSDGMWYFSVAAYNSESVESPRSAQLAVKVANAAAAAAGAGSGAENVNLSASADVEAMAAAGTDVQGGLDKGSDAFSAKLIGNSLTWSGTSFNLLPPGAPNGVTSASIALPEGNYSSLALLAAAVDGSQAAQSFVVHYSDGTSSTIKQSVSDWAKPESYPGESIVLTMPYRISGTGEVEDGSYFVYGYSLAINSAKTVTSVTLPANRDVVVLAATLMP